MTQSYLYSNFKDAYWSTKPITSEIEPDWIESICPIREQSEQRGWDLGLGFNIQRQLKIFGFLQFGQNTCEVKIWLEYIQHRLWQWMATLNIEIVVMACLPIFVVVFTFCLSYLHFSRDSQPHLQPPHSKIRGC